MGVSYVEFHDNRSSWSRADTRGRTDRHTDRQTQIQRDRQTDRLDEANGHFWRVPERASNEGL